MTMEKRELYIIGTACIIVVAAVVAFIASQTKAPAPAPQPGSGTAEEPGAAVSPSGAPTGYSASIPIGAMVTAAAAEAPAAPNASETFRAYNISISKDGYSPSSVTVKKGDVVQLRLTALDGTYDFAVPYTGLYQSIRQGETKQVGFGATMMGSFEFGCRDRCPVGGVLKGQIVVIP